MMAAGDEPWFCYMVQCRDSSLYVGAARDPALRVERHNQGLGAKHTALRRPVTLVWQEEHPIKRSARGRQAELERLAERKEIEPDIRVFGVKSPFALNCGLRVIFQDLGLEKSGE